ncbi:hypothetical protein BDF14DRAFT_1001435 [Spinellus fusiger]|nr:hypothetical protein BDF14DRAFT_1001435 [Spinellus fusiger]
MHCRRKKRKEINCLFRCSDKLLLLFTLSQQFLNLFFLLSVMFFETAYIPSPQLSATSQDNDAIPSPLLSPCLVPLPPSDLSEESLSNEPINHIVFVIHGIGQQTEQYGHFYENIDNLRETTRQILQAKLPERNPMFSFTSQSLVGKRLLIMSLNSLIPPIKTFLKSIPTLMARL